MRNLRLRRRRCDRHRCAGHGHPHDHTHPHHDHDHDHEHPHTETISLEQRVLAKNDVLAEQNRQWLAERGILAFNITSSPGAGKTTLLERTIRHLGSQRQVSVIEGDQETLLDADRITAAGARAVQVNTGAGCHLDADMIERALHTLEPDSGSLLFIENVGNLVCPALFDLGEHSKVVVISVTEGTDKPLKYPHMFAAAGLVLINKIDLLPYVDFDLDRLRAARPFGQSRASRSSPSRLPRETEWTSGTSGLTRAQVNCL